MMAVGPKPGPGQAGASLPPGMIPAPGGTPQLPDVAHTDTGGAGTGAGAPADRARIIHPTGGPKLKLSPQPQPHPHAAQPPHLQPQLPGMVPMGPGGMGGKVGLMGHMAPGSHGGAPPHGHGGMYPLAGGAQSGPGAAGAGTDLAGAPGAAGAAGTGAGGGGVAAVPGFIMQPGGRGGGHVGR